MDTRIVEVRKNIVIARDLDNNISFSANINIDFIPDEVIVKHILFTTRDPTIPDNYSTSIYSDMVNDIIGSFSDVPSGNSNSPNISFTLQKPIKGIYNFQILGANSNTNNNEMVLSYRTGDITLHLEFIKYKTVKPDIVY